MKTLVLLTILSLSVAAGAKNGRPISCHSGSGFGDMVSISACVNESGNELMKCKGQDRRHLGTAYLTLERVHFKSGRVISAPLIETVLIPAHLVSVNLTPEAFVIKMQNEDVGTLDLRAPNEPTAMNGKKHGRYFDVKVKGIQHELESVVCQYRK